jgi:hypothetical protein
MTVRTKEVAKQVILEIIRQAGGVLNYKTSLFKAFYHAHLHYAETQSGYLSTWPIVRMPRGPGIDRFDALIGELLAEGAVETQQVECGEYEGFQFRLGHVAPRRNVLPSGAAESIAYGVQQVARKSATQVSEESHAVSRAWREARDGEELNIYTDLLSPAEYSERMRRASEIAATLQGVWGS